jgi:hypothetical protein
MLADRDEYVTAFVADSLMTAIRTLAGAPLVGRLTEFMLKRSEREDSVSVEFTLEAHPRNVFSFNFSVFEEGVEPIRGVQLDVGVFYSSLVERVRQWQRTSDESDGGVVQL